MPRLSVLILFGFAILTIAPANAQILKCKSATGQVTYTQGECPPGTSNENVPDSIKAASVPGRSASSAAQPRPLSRRAAEIKALYVNSCLANNMVGADCAKFREISQRCLVDATLSNTTECRAMQEYLFSIADQQRMAQNEATSRSREKCSAGDRAACEAVACSNGALRGSDADVRACSRAQSAEYF